LRFVRGFVGGGAARRMRQAAQVRRRRSVLTKVQEAQGQPTAGTSAI